MDNNRSMKPITVRTKKETRKEGGLSQDGEVKGSPAVTRRYQDQPLL